MEKIICKLEVLTPMFLGGAPQTKDGKPICELRTQSIKGVIRYWYRALVSPDRLNEEAKLFGSSNEQIGASKAKIFIDDKNDLNIQKVDMTKGHTLHDLKEYTIRDTVTTPKGRKDIQINPLYYLAYGPAEYYKTEAKLKISRSYIKEGSRFNIKFILLRCEPFQLDGFYQSLCLMLNFGGLGSRSRKGFGALKLLNEEEVFKDRDWFVTGNLTQTLKNIINNKTPAQSLYSKEYSYLDTDTKFWLSKKGVSTWNECLSMLGRDYHNWRQVLPVANGRENLGTPLLHGNKQIENKRRASSYFLTIFKFDKGDYKYGVFHIPSNYSKDINISSNIQQEHHEKFQREIEKNTDREV